MANTPTQIRVDSDIKNKANAIFHDLGIDMSGAVNLFLHQCVICGGIPFDVRLPGYSKRVEDAMEEARKISRDASVAGYNSMDELKAALRE